MTLLALILTTFLVLGCIAIAFLYGKAVGMSAEPSKRLINVPSVKVVGSLFTKTDWTAEDVAALRAFHGTPTGAKYLQNAQAMIASACIDSCSDVMHTSHSAGVGHGMNEFHRWYQSLASNEMLQSLSAPAPYAGTNTSEDFGQSSLLEKLSP